MLHISSLVLEVGKYVHTHMFSHTEVLTKPQYSETSLMGPPMGPKISVPITENLIIAATEATGLIIKGFQRINTYS